MSLLKKLVGLTIGAAAVGAAAYFLNRNEHTEEYEHIWGPEDEADAEDGTAETAEPADDASAEAEEAPAAPEETAAAPVEEAPTTKVCPFCKSEIAIEATRCPHCTPVQAPAGDDTPNANPVELGAVEVPKTEDGKLDVTKIADPADFGDWDERGCKG